MLNFIETKNLQAKGQVVLMFDFILGLPLYFFVVSIVLSKDLQVLDIFKAAYLWLRCGTRPNLIFDDDKNRIIFLFPDDEKTKNAVKDYLSDAGGIKTFVEFYKILRSEMYVVKGQGKNGKNEF